MYQNLPNAVPPLKAADSPILQTCYKRILSQVNSCNEAATRIENAIDRLLNPAPRPTNDCAPVPQPQTLESMLNGVGGSTEQLAERLNELANRLERAI